MQNLAMCSGSYLILMPTKPISRYTPPKNTPLIVHKNKVPNAGLLKMLAFYAA